jgi:predicted GH43/DUF377 family glycosyl hydrolase
MKWEKLGNIVSPDKNISWMSKKVGPSFVEIVNNQFKIYITGRSLNNESRIGIAYIDIDTLETIKLEEDVVFDVGEIGTFDESGVSYPWIVRNNDRIFMYYVGWISGTKAGFKNATGLAEYDKTSNIWVRVSKAPILPLTKEEPFDTGSIAVTCENDQWRMYYTSFDKRVYINDRPINYYNIKYATSTDGINWNRNGEVCINFKNDKEYAIGKPMILKNDNNYEMWYSYSDGFYKIGYATSTDGINWTRKDRELGLLPSKDGWDSEMVEYGYVLECNGDKYMFYNGNGYGETGLGVAILKDK